MFEKKESLARTPGDDRPRVFHLENMMNFEQLPRPTRFQAVRFPVKWVMSRFAGTKQWRSTKSKFFAI